MQAKLYGILDRETHITQVAGFFWRQIRDPHLLPNKLLHFQDILNSKPFKQLSCAPPLAKMLKLAGFDGYKSCSCAPRQTWCYISWDASSEPTFYLDFSDVTVAIARQHPAKTDGLVILAHFWDISDKETHIKDRFVTHACFYATHNTFKLI